MSTSVPILDRAGELLARYDVIFSDIWGVVHDGCIAYRPACDALARFREDGGTVVLVSNATVPWDAVVGVLDEKQVRRDCYDSIVSSGDIAIDYVTERGFARIHRVGPERDRALFDRLPSHVALEDAEAIVFSGLVDDRNEEPEDYRALIEAGLARRLPFVCTNPDLAVHVGPDLLPCSGAVATLYEEAGGEVYWAGKPHRSAFAAAAGRAVAEQGKPLDPLRTLMIGDAVRTDIAGARDFGIDALFVAGGLHRDEVMRDGAVDAAALARLFAGNAPRAIAAVSALRW